MSGRLTNFKGTIPKMLRRSALHHQLFGFCMALSRNSEISKSGAIQDFMDFYGFDEDDTSFQALWTAQNKMEKEYRSLMSENDPILSEFVEWANRFERDVNEAHQNRSDV